MVFQQYPTPPARPAGPPRQEPLAGANSANAATGGVEPNERRPREYMETRPKLPQLVRIPADGTIYQAQPPFRPRSIEIINASNVNFTMTEDSGDVTTIPAGNVVVMTLPAGTVFQFKAASAATSGYCRVYFYPNDRPTSGNLAAAGGGGGGGAITGPLGTGAAGTGVRIEGEGTAGTPVGGVLSVQGVAGGIAQPANITQIGGAAVTLGAKTSANSIPTVLASDQAAIPVSESGAWSVTPVPLTSGGWTAFLNAGLTNTAVAVKAAAGQVGGWYCYNPAAAVTYLQLFNLVAGSVVLGTTVPILSIGIPPGGGANVEFSMGIPFGAAISAAATTTPTGAVAPATALVANILSK